MAGCVGCVVVVVCVSDGIVMGGGVTCKAVLAGADVGVVPDIKIVLGCCGAAGRCAVSLPATSL